MLGPQDMLLMRGAAKLAAATAEIRAILVHLDLDHLPQTIQFISGRCYVASLGRLLVVVVILHDVSLGFGC